MNGMLKRFGSTCGSLLHILLARRPVWILGAALMALTPSVGMGQTANLLNRVLNERMIAYERQLAVDINQAVTNYLAPSQYVLAVNVLWHPGALPGVAQRPALSDERTKLPGFPIYIQPNQCDVLESGTAATVRVEVKVLLDETLPNYYEGFLHKVIPIVARLDFNRGDRVIVLKENFPMLSKFRKKAVIEPGALMKEAEKAKPAGKTPVLPSTSQQAAPAMPAFQPNIIVQPQIQAPAGTPGSAPPVAAPPPGRPETPLEAARSAFESRKFPEALGIVDQSLREAKSGPERSLYLGMKGSIFYSMDDLDGARDAWEQAAEEDSTNREVRDILKFLKSQPEED